MLLNDYQIASWADTGGMTPFNRNNLNPNSVDLTIGDEIAVEKNNGELGLVKLHLYSEGAPFYLHPEQFGLIKVAEYIDLSLPGFIEEFNFDEVFLTARAVGKSGRAREGLDLLNAGFAEAGYKGNLTLAVKNQRTRAVQALWPGKRFAQLLLTPCRRPSNLYNGHYQGDTGVQPSRGHFTTNH
jgi:deoxycytidine triphosphate deaminase